MSLLVIPATLVRIASREYSVTPRPILDLARACARRRWQSWTRKSVSVSSNCQSL